MRTVLGFYEDDEDPREVCAAFSRVQHGLTAAPCATASFTGNLFAQAVPTTSVTTGTTAMFTAVTFR